ncbi:hypothetical protein, partial [Rubricoccus marinus]|uniref:hypothetical protein n=1 Tax=Rubricoccus marinus TaxID=716817 RepID=UPI00117AF32E
MPALDAFFEWLHGALRGHTEKSDLLREYDLLPPAPSSTAADAAPTAQPDGLVIALADGDTKSDPLGSSAGLGVLLRPADNGTPAPASCLTLADLHAAGRTLTEAALVPIRLVPRNGLLRPLVTYQNHPLSAVSPAAGFVAPSLVPDRMGDADDGVDDTAPVFRNPYGSASGWSLARLSYGASYQVAAFQTGSGGILPREIAQDDEPTRLDPDKLESPGAVDAWADYVHQRLIAVGPLRLSTPSPGSPRGPGLSDRLELPPVPEGVFPLARSLERSQDPKNPAGPAPLLLLRPPQTGTPGRGAGRSAGRRRVPAPSTFTLEIRPPVVDPDVWLQCLQTIRPNDTPPADPAPPLERTRSQAAHVLAESAKRRSTGEPVKGTGVPDNLCDPFVLGLDAVLTRIDQNVPDAAKQESITFRLPSMQGGLSGEEVDAIGCEISVDERASLRVDGQTLKVQAPEGSVWRLSLRPTLRQRDGHGFFRSPPAGDGAPQKGLPEYGGARDLLIEVATPHLPAPDDLYEALHVESFPSLRETTLVTDPDGSPALGDGGGRPAERLVVSLNGAALGDRARWLHDARVLVQEWAWDGRPLEKDQAVEPIFQPPGNGVEYPAWDATLFGDRPPSGAESHPAIADFGLCGASPRAVLYTRDLSPTRGAQAYRVAVEVTSRYAPLWDDAPTRASYEAGRESVEDAPFAWRHRVVPSRLRQTPPPPSIRFIVPLTEAASTDADPRAAGALVLLNEPWFAHGGLSEVLTAEIVTTDVPPGADGQAARLLEIGPDPILTGEARPLPESPSLPLSESP